MNEVDVHLMDVRISKDGKYQITLAVRVDGEELYPQVMEIGDRMEVRKT